MVLPGNGYSIREEQIDLSKKMYIGFTEKQAALCEAEVGTGKTLSYLVAAIVAKHHNGIKYGQNLPVTVTTSSIELQKAIVEREIPNLSKMLLDYYIIEKPLTAVLRKGKEHYFCRYRFEDFFKNIKKYPEKYKTEIEILKQIEKTCGCIDLDKYRISGTLKSRICVKGSCAGCRRMKDCAYSDFCSKMYSCSELDFQVTNHNMYLMAQKTKAEDHLPLLRESCFVVVDEAHKFKEAAEDTFGEKIGEKDIEKYVNGVKFLRSPVSDRIKYRESLEKLLKENTELFKSLRKLRHDNDIDEDRESIIKLSAIQTGRLKRMMQLIEKIEDMKINRSYGIPVTGMLLKNAITALNKGSSIVWLDTDENGILSLCCTPKDINNILREKVW